MSKIIKNYIYNAGYQVFVLIVPLITIPYITRVLKPYGVGVNSFTNSIVSYFVLLGSIGISLYGNREIAYVRDDKLKRSQNFIEIELLRMLFTALSLIAFFIFVELQDQYQNIYLLQGIAIIANGIDISWYFMGIENFKVTVLRNFLVKLVSVASIFIFVKTADDLPVYVMILSLSTFFGNLTLWPYLKKEISFFGIKKINVIRHILPAVVLFIPQIATQIYLVLNKTMLGLLDTVTAAGFFDNSDKIIKVALTVVTSIGTVMLPRIAYVFKKGRMEDVLSYLKTSFDFVTFGAVPLMFGVMAVAKPFSIWFFGKDFAATGILLFLEAPVMLPIAWNNVIGVQYLMPVGRNKEFNFSLILGAFANLISNIPLIYFWGARGAVISTLISESVIIVYQLYRVRNQLDIHELYHDTWKYLLAGIIMMAVVYMIQLKLSMGAINLIFMVIVGAAVYLIGIYLLKPKLLIDFLKNRGEKK